MTHFSHLYRTSVLCKLNKNSIMVDRLVNSEANARRIAMVENCFGSSGQPLAEQGRVLVGEGVLTKMCRKKPKARQFFLFNDILVYGNIVINKKKYNKQHVIPLEEVKLESLKDEGQYRNGWLIRTASKSFAVYAATATEKEEWMAHIEKCIEDLLRKSGKQPPSEHAAVWVPDNEAAICMHCKKTQFTVLNRRHHCRKCGSVVCGPCSSKRYVLRGQSEKPLRVCLQCYDELTRDRARPAHPAHPAHQDVDHRNLISLTHQPSTPQPVSIPHIVDQDYRVPPMVPPTDIVESVDMDLSEDEEQQGMYPTQQIQNEHHRRNSFNNNKVLVGGDTEKANHVDNNHINLVQMNTNAINARGNDGPHSAPIVTPLSNPFDNMPSGLKFNIPPTFQNITQNYKKPASFEDIREDVPKDSVYEDDLRNRSLEIPVDRRNVSPPEYEDFTKDGEWQAGPRPYMNQRFPRNWGPRTNFRPQSYSPQFWPRNGPRPANRWMGPRPQRFW